MGPCLSCLKGKKSNEENDVELSSTTNMCMCGSGLHGINVKFSLNEGTSVINVTGSGTLIGSCGLDCDTGYWEVVIGKTPKNVAIGVKRYVKGNSLDLTLSSKNGDWCMEADDLVFKEGDVVGIYWDQTDLPMLSFTLNGQPVSKCSITRVRPANDIYPAVSVTEGATCEVVFDAAYFKHPPPTKKFSMIVCATQLI